MLNELIKPSNTLGLGFCFCYKQGWPLLGSWHIFAKLVDPKRAESLEQGWRAAAPWGTLASSTSLPSPSLSGKSIRLPEAQPAQQAPRPSSPAVVCSLLFRAPYLHLSAQVSLPTFWGSWFEDPEDLPWTTRSHTCHVQLCKPMDCSPPGSSVHGILQARTLEALPCPPPGDLPNPGIETCLLGLLHWQVDFLPLVPPRKPALKSILVQMPCPSTFIAPSPHTRFPTLAPPAFSFMGLSVVNWVNASGKLVPLPKMRAQRAHRKHQMWLSTFIYWPGQSMHTWTRETELMNRQPRKVSLCF